MTVFNNQIAFKERRIIYCQKKFRLPMTSQRNRKTLNFNGTIDPVFLGTKIKFLFVLCQLEE